MRRTLIVMCMAALLGSACSGSDGGTSSPTVATPAPGSSTSVLATTPTTNAPPSTSPATDPPTTPTAAPTTAVPSGEPCAAIEGAGAPAGAYGEAGFDRFGPLHPAPSLTITFGTDRLSDGGGVAATRIEGGVLVSASHSPDVPAQPGDRVPVAAVNHDGSLRWSRCLDGSRVVQTIVAATDQRPASALLLMLTGNVPTPQFEFVQVSLATGAEMGTFSTAMAAVGVDADDLTRLSIADASGRFALLVDRTGDAANWRLVRYDLSTDVAIDVGVPAELVPAADPGPCQGAPEPSLSADGDVIVTVSTRDVVSGATEVHGTGAVLARWHDGTWSNDPDELSVAVGVRPGFACQDDAAARVLRGVDALGEIQWIDADLTHPGADDIGWYPDGSITVGQVCTQRTGDACDRVELIGLDPITGDVRWTRAGLRLVAADPADGYALVWAEPVGDILEPPGWELLDDRTGQPVAGQSWDDPDLFTLYPSREVAGFNRTVRAGGLIVVVHDRQVRVWYPQGTGGQPRELLLP